jgi:DNA-directed RNA polymerase subunit RPC12/RpoP
LVRVALRNFRNKTGFHECPRCKSRSVWKTDPQNTLEDTLHLLLGVYPYRCARCDKRFMDAKASAAEASAPPNQNRWLAYLRSTGSRILRLVQRTPFEEGLRLNSILGSGSNSEKHQAALSKNVERLTKAS